MYLQDLFLIHGWIFVFFSLDYEKIFSLLEEVQGPVEIQKYFVEFAIKEAARFVQMPWSHKLYVNLDYGRKSNFSRPSICVFLFYVFQLLYLF